MNNELENLKKEQDLPICKRTERRYKMSFDILINLKKVFHLASGLINNIELKFPRAPLAACGKLATFTVILTFIFLSTTHAQTMSNSNFIIQMGNLNSGAGISTGSNFRLNQTLGQTGANLFSGTNYKVRAGFQYVLSIIAFKFSISNIFIDFGTLSPTTPVLRTNLLSVSNGSAGGFQVTSSENHPLLVPATGQMIPDTKCDSGTCTQSSPGVWSSSLTYGFGYTCTNTTGTTCASGFSNGADYAPFAASPSAVTVMSSSNVGRNFQSTITYQLNVSRVQAAGLYTNIINYIATPTF